MSTSDWLLGGREKATLMVSGHTGKPASFSGVIIVSLNASVRPDDGHVTNGDNNGLLPSPHTEPEPFRLITSRRLERQAEDFFRDRPVYYYYP
jgi:hypothetical protein